MRWEIYTRKDNLVGIRLIGNNGEKVLQSEGYHNTGNARRAIKRIRGSITQAPVILIKADPAITEEGHRHEQ